MFIGKVYAGEKDQSLPFEITHRGRRSSECVCPAVFYLDKTESLPLVADYIDLASSAPPVSLNDPVAGASQE